MPMVIQAGCLDLRDGDGMYLKRPISTRVLKVIASPALALLSSRLGPAKTMIMRAPGQGPCVNLWEKPSALGTAIIMVLGAGSDCSPQVMSQALKTTRSQGGLGICIATKPFLFEGHKRQKKANETLKTLVVAADLLLVIDHEVFLKSDGMTVMEASMLSNDAVLLAVQVISELISPRSATTFFMASPNATTDMSTIEVIQLLRSSGKAKIGFGRGFSAAEAIKRACVASPFLGYDSSMPAKGLVICALSSSTLPVHDDKQEVAGVVRSLVHPESNCTCFSFQDNTLEPGVVQATVIVTRLRETDAATPGTTCTVRQKLKHEVWDSGPSRDIARVWAESRNNSSSMHPLPHDPAAVPRGGLLGAMRSMASAILTGNAQPPSLIQRAASMLEIERSQKGLAPTVEMDFKKGTFKGRCEGGLPDGKGHMTYADGSFYDGHWRQGKRDGIGSFYYANGDMYQGSWHEDFKHGQGWVYFHSGDRLQAEFVKGKAHGQGRYYSVDGSLLFGTFVDNWRHGECVCIDASGSRWLETYDRGVLVSRKTDY